MIKDGFQVNPLRLAKTHNTEPGAVTQMEKKTISASTSEYRTEKGNSTPNFCPSAFIVKNPQEDGHCDILKAALARLDTGDARTHLS